MSGKRLIIGVCVISLLIVCIGGIIFLSGFGETDNDNTGLQASLEAEYNTSTVEITHKSGDDIPLNKFVLIVDGEPQYVEHNNDKLSSGETITHNNDEYWSEEEIKIGYEDENGETQILFVDNAPKEGIPMPSASFEFFFSESKLLIKHTSGETVELNNIEIYRDGSRISEPKEGSLSKGDELYIAKGQNWQGKEITVKYNSDKGSTPISSITSPHSEMRGSGTMEDPYVITTASQLQNIEKDLDAHYTVGNNIDASQTKNWNNGKGFDPIGNNEKAFTGNIDGNRYEIYGLTINRPNEEYNGLFGVISNESEIQRIGITKAQIIGDDHTGILVGEINNGTVKQSYSTGSIQGKYNTGGLVGNIMYGNITKSYSKANVGSNQSRVGGLVGLIYHGEVSKAYSIGNVNGKKSVGGLVGYIQYTNIDKSYSTGKVEAELGPAGGLVGRDDIDGNVTNSYWDMVSSGQSESDGGRRLSTHTMTGDNAKENMNNLDFGSIWNVTEDEYPSLYWEEYK